MCRNRFQFLLASEKESVLRICYSDVIPDILGNVLIHSAHLVFF